MQEDYLEFLAWRETFWEAFGKEISCKDYNEFGIIKIAKEYGANFNALRLIFNKHLAILQERYKEKPTEEQK